MNSKRYKARIVISGCEDQFIYGADQDRLARRAFKILTAREPGLGNTWPQKVVLYRKTGDISGNRSQWESFFVATYNEVKGKKL